MSICPYYTSEHVATTSKVLTSNRTSNKPVYHDSHRCSHPESKNKPGTITQNVSCEGNIEHCTIPAKQK